MVFPFGGAVPVRGAEGDTNYPPIGYVGALFPDRPFPDRSRLP